MRNTNDTYTPHLFFNDGFVNDYPSLSYPVGLNRINYGTNYTSETPRFFIKEKEEAKSFDYIFCMTGVSKEDLGVQIRDEKIVVRNSNEDSILLIHPLCFKCKKMKIKDVTATLKNGILTISIIKNKEDELNVKVE